MHYELTMTPLDTLLRELFEIEPSLRIEYCTKTKKTTIINGDIAVSSAESLSQAIVLAWLHYFRREE